MMPSPPLSPCPSPPPEAGPDIKTYKGSDFLKKFSDELAQKIKTCFDQCDPGYARLEDNPIFYGRQNRFQFNIKISDMSIPVWLESKQITSYEFFVDAFNCGMTCIELGVKQPKYRITQLDVEKLEFTFGIKTLRVGEIWNGKLIDLCEIQKQAGLPKTVHNRTFTPTIQLTP